MHVHPPGRSRHHCAQSTLRWKTIRWWVPCRICRSPLQRYSPCICPPHSNICPLDGTPQGNRIDCVNLYAVGVVRKSANWYGEFFKHPQLFLRYCQAGSSYRHGPTQSCLWRNMNKKKRKEKNSSTPQIRIRGSMSLRYQGMVSELMGRWWSKLQWPAGNIWKPKVKSHASILADLIRRGPELTRCPSLAVRNAIEITWTWKNLLKKRIPVYLAKPVRVTILFKDRHANTRLQCSVYPSNRKRLDLHVRSQRFENLVSWF